MTAPIVSHQERLPHHPANHAEKVDTATFLAHLRLDGGGATGQLWEREAERKPSGAHRARQRSRGFVVLPRLPDERFPSAIDHPEARAGVLTPGRGFIAVSTRIAPRLISSPMRRQNVVQINHSNDHSAGQKGL